jgi:hypothetical protein
VSRLLDNSSRLSVDGPGQGQAPMARIKAVGSQGILFVASRAQQRIAPQLGVIVDIFVAQCQTVDALSQQLAHRVVHKHLLPLVPKALGQAVG